MIFNLGLGAEKPFNNSNLSVVADFEQLLSRKVIDNYSEIGNVARANDLENHFEYLKYIDYTLSDLNDVSAINFDKVKSMIMIREKLLAMFYAKIQVVFYPNIEYPNQVRLLAYYTILDLSGKEVATEIELDNLLPENASSIGINELYDKDLKGRISKSVFTKLSNQISIPDDFIGEMNTTKDKDNQRIANFMLRTLTASFSKLETQFDLVDINSTLNLIKRDFKILTNVLNKIDLLLIQKGKIR
jgi:hypothetical protein